MEIRIDDKQKCDLFFKLFPVLFDVTLGNFDSYVLKINKEGLFIKQKDEGSTTQLDVEYSKDAFDYISDEEVYIKFNGNHIRKILEAANKTKSDKGVILKFTNSRTPFLQVLTPQKQEIRLESLTEEDKEEDILPYVVEKYASISDLKNCSKLISTLGTILDKKETASVGLELRKDLLIIHAKDDEGIKYAHYEIESTTNTETIQSVDGYFHHLEYIKGLIDSGAESLRFYVQTDHSLIFEIKFPFKIKITIYAARAITS